MAHRIHISDTSSISVDTLVLADKSGTGPCTVQPPSGTSIQMLGLRQGYSNITSNRTIGLHESNYVWTNSGASSLTMTLPSGALEGFSVWLVRTGGAITVDPTSAGRIWNTSNGTFRSAGTTIQMASSGCKLKLVCDGSDGWYPTLEEGTIS